MSWIQRHLARKNGCPNCGSNCNCSSPLQKGDKKDQKKYEKLFNKVKLKSGKENASIDNDTLVQRFSNNPAGLPPNADNVTFNSGTGQYTGNYIRNKEEVKDNDGLLQKRKKKPDVRKTTKGKGRNFRTTKEGAGMTAAGVRKYKAKNPGSKLKTAVTGKVKPGSKAAKRRKSFCARSKGWTGERGRAARRRWKC